MGCSSKLYAIFGYLPNITGGFGTGGQAIFGSWSIWGAFYADSEIKDMYLPNDPVADTNDRYGFLNMFASSSNSTYKDIATVQPSSIRLLIIVRF